MSTFLGARTIVLIFADVAIIYAGILIALYLRLDFDGAVFQLAENNGWVKAGFATTICTVSLYLHDLYDYTALNDRREMSLRLVQAIGAAWALLAVVFYFFPSLMMGRGTAVLSIAVSVILLATFRTSIHFLLGHPRLAERILIVGDRGVIGDTADAVAKRRDAGYRIVGYASDEPEGRMAMMRYDIRNLGSISEVESITRRERIDRIVIGVRERRGAFPAETLLRLRLTGDASIEESTSFFERVTGQVHLDNLRPSYLIFSIRPRETRLTSVIRDLMQRGLALVGLVLSLPLAVVTAILIKLESHGDCFYRQERVGRNGRVFTLYKFRSMKPDAEANGEPMWATTDDDRATIVGRIIRKIRVDEIPQFWNILKGEMSFIGPRPERPYFVSELAKAVPYYEHRHLVAPGLTGWAQIKYPYGASVDDARQKLQYDLYYIKNQSLTLDVVILVETIKTVMFGRGGR